MIRLLLRYGGDSPAYCRYAQHLVRQTVSSSGVAEAEAFILIARWVEGQLLNQLGTEEWSAALRIAMAWAHGNRLFGVLRSGGVLLRRLRVNFSRLDQAAWGTTFREPVTDLGEAAHPRRVSICPFLVFSLDYAVGPDLFLEEATRVRLRDITCQEGEDVWWPRLEILREHADTHNVLGSFLHGDGNEALTRLAFDIGVLPVTSAGMVQLVNDHLQVLRADPGTLGSWTILERLAGDRPLAPEAALVFDEVASATSFVDLVNEDTEAGLRALQFAVWQSIWYSSSSVTPRLRNEMLTVAAILEMRRRVDARHNQR